MRASATLPLSVALILLLSAGMSRAADPVVPADAGAPDASTPPTEAPIAPPLPVPGPPPAAPTPPPLPPSPAPDVPAPLLPPLQIHAFVSQGFIKSTKNNYLTESKRGSFEFTEVGINFTQVLTDRLRAGVQFFSREVGKVGDYRPRVDWFYLDYAFSDWLGLRAGRTKVPFGLYNEVNDTDSARIPILLPQAIYPILNRDLLLALTGLDLYGYVRLGPVGALDYRVYGGTLYVDPPVAAPPLTLVDFRIPYIFGARLLWETPLEGLRLGGSVQALRFDTFYALPPAMPGMPPGRLDLKIPFLLWLASVEYAAHDVLFAFEYGRWHADLESNLGPTTRVTNERYYAMGAYRVTPWFAPGAYYSVLIPDINKRSGQENYQHDVAVTLRFDINAYWIVKLEGHFVRGTAEMSSALNDGTPLSMLARDWLLFLAKTTVSF